MTNKYSFCNVKKSDILDLYDPSIEENSTNDNSIENISEENIGENNEEVTIYIHENELIMQECCFQAGETKLYRDNEDGTLAVLYECEKDGNSNLVTIYTPDGVYNVVDIDDKINFASYMNVENYQTLVNMISQDNKKSFKGINQLRISYYTANNSFPIVVNENVIHTEEYVPFKKLYNRYKIATKYIPASNMLNNILEQINHYIVTRPN